MHSLYGYQDNQLLRDDLKRFEADPNYRIDPSKYNIPETAVAAQGHIDNLIGKQQTREASPTVNALARFAAQGFGSDPSFNQQEWTQGMMDLGGVKPPAGNPVAAKALTDFMTQGGAERDAQLAAGGDISALARISARSKDPSVGLKDVSMANDNFTKRGELTADRTQEAEALRRTLGLDAGTYGTTPGVSPSLDLRQRTAAAAYGLTSPAALKQLAGFAADVDKQWGGQAFNRNTSTIGTGNATKKIVEVTDPLGKFVKTEEVANHPKAASGGADPASAPLYVSWVSPSGAAQAATVPRSELPALKSSLEAQGIKEIETVDGKRASRTETLIKPDKKKRGGLGDRPGGGAPVGASVSVVRDANGNLTVKR
jgi:hypothetical protein